MIPFGEETAESNRTARALDFDIIRKQLGILCKTGEGAQICRDLFPVAKKEDTELLLNLCEETISLKKSGYLMFPVKVEDPAQALKKTSAGLLPEKKEIKEVTSFFTQLKRIAAFLASPPPGAVNLVKAAEALDPLEETTRFFDDTFDSEGNVKPTATAALIELDGRINSLRKNIAKKAEGLLLRDDVKDLLQDSYISTRNDRVVIPIRAEYKNVFQGIIHGISGTEQTAFMEPQELVKDNNSLREAISEWEEEIAKLLREAAAKLKRNEKEIRKNSRIMAELDSISARAEFSAIIGGHRPTFQEGGAIAIKNLRHPMMVFAEENPRPNSIGIEAEEKALVISGPNAGGKTVLLKSLALSFALPSCGILPPLGAGSSMPFASKIFAMVGDEQSIEKGESTFSAQLVGIRDALIHSREGDIVIIDEILNGTDPQQATALALTVIEEFLGKNCRVFVSTHLPDLKITAQETEGMVNGAMGFGEDGHPTFRLEKGHPGVSYPLAIAASVGIPDSIIKRAKERLSSSSDIYQEALMELQKKADLMDKSILENERLTRESKAIKADLSAELKKAETLAKSYEEDKNKKIREEVKKARSKVSAIIEEARIKGKEEKEKAAAVLKTMENRLTREIVKPESIPVENIKEGDWVWIIPFDRKAKLEKLGPDEKVEVSSGGVRMTLSKSDIVGIKEGKPDIRIRVDSKTVSADTEMRAPEISLLGLTFDESIARLEPFLDSHMLHNTPQVRIVHGKGVLKNRVENYLRESPYVNSFKPAPPAHGGDGASIVELN